MGLKSFFVGPAEAGPERDERADHNDPIDPVPEADVDNEHLRSLARSYRVMRNMIVITEELRTALNSAHQKIEGLEAENRTMSRQFHSLKRDRDHFFKAFSALEAQVKSAASGMVTALNMAERHSYGDKGTSVDGRITDKRDAPRFLRQRQPQNGEKKAPWNDPPREPPPLPREEPQTQEPAAEQPPARPDLHYLEEVLRNKGEPA